MRGSRAVLGLALLLSVGAGVWTILSRNSADSPALPERARPVAAAQETTPAATSPADPHAASTALPVAAPSAFGTFRGRVIDAATREPVREFEVRFHGARSTKGGDEAPGARTFRTQDGRFEWEYLPPGRWAVTATANGYQRFELFDLQIPRGSDTAEIVLLLRRGHTLRGRVFDEESGAGIAAASIAFRESGVGRFDGNFRMRIREAAAKDGSFALDGVPPGRITLEVSAQEYAGTEIDVAVRDGMAALEVALSAGGTIAGRLTAADGVTPLAGSAGLYNVDLGSGFSARTSESGEFRYEHLAPGRYSVHGQSQAGGVALEVVLARNQRIENLVLAVGAGRTVRGVITGLRPEDLKRTDISIRRSDHEVGTGGQTHPDERGAYAIRGVTPGRVQVVADVQMRRQLAKDAEVPADADITVNISFPPGVRLSGRVTRAGKPAAGLEVRPRPLVEQRVFVYGANTSKNGEYAIEDLAPGDYHVVAGDYRSKLIQVAGDTVLDIELPTAHLSGRVVEDGGKVPVVGADVEIWPADAVKPLGYRLRDRSDHFGQFALDGLEPGDFMLTAYKPGYEMFRERISFQAPVADMTLRLKPGKGVEVRLRDAATGKPLRSAYAQEIIGQRSGTSLQLALDEDGVGYLPAALAGTRLSFFADGYSGAVIESWSGQPLDLHLERREAQ